MSDFKGVVFDAVSRQTLLSAVLSKRRTERAADRVTVRPVTLRGERVYQFAYRHGERETHENLKPADAAVRIASLLDSDYKHCHLYTTEADYSARVGSGGRIHYRRRPPSKQPQSTAHNRRKQYLIAEGTPCPFLVEIGVMTSSGKVRAARCDKFRQVNRFLELVNDVVGHLPPGDPLKVVDFGCGKSYLTFALHHLLTVVHKRRVEIVGLDRNGEVIRNCRRIAERLKLDGIEFLQGDIAGYQRDGRVNLAVSLHACDTATDDALAQALRWQSDVILAVPCCQHELAQKIESERLKPILEHGILKERLAAIATDALRAQALKICGYQVQVVEFIEMEHTAKNVLIRALRTGAACAASDEKIESYRSLKALLGLKQIYLEEALGAEFVQHVS